MSSNSSPPTPTGGLPSERRAAEKRSGASGADEGWSVVSTILSGILMWGGIGWLLDNWLGTRALLPIGVVLGAGLAIYLVIKKVGGLPQPTPTARTRSTARPGATRTSTSKPAERRELRRIQTPSAPSRHDASAKDE